MLKKLFALILVAFFVFGGSGNQVSAQSSGECSMRVKNSRESQFTSGPIQIFQGEGIDIEVSNIRTTSSSPISSLDFYIRGSGSSNAAQDFDVGPVQNQGSSINYSIVRANMEGNWTQFAFAQNTGFGVHHPTLCVNQNTIEFVDAPRVAPTCNIEVVVKKNTAGTRYMMMMSGRFADFSGDPNSNYIMNFYKDNQSGEWFQALFPGVYAPSTTGLYSGTVTSGRSSVAPFELGSNEKNTTGDVYVVDKRTNKVICDESYDFKAAVVDDDFKPIEIPGADTLYPISKFTLCGQLPENTPERDACDSCARPDAEGNPKGIYSAIGCIPVDEKGFLRQMIQLLLSVSGMIALLSILAGAFLLSTSQGDANQVKKAKELITAAVSGLLFIIFSTIILDFIGVQILRIPGLS